MTKKHIEKLTQPEIDYAVAVAQGWFKPDIMWCRNINGETKVVCSHYYPTTNQGQCGKLIDDFKITCRFSSRKEWCAWMAEDIKSYAHCDKSRLVAACKAFLWSKYPDGMVDIQE